VARDTPSAVTVAKRGYIQVTSTTDNSVLGYISKNTFSQAQFRYQPDQADAVIVDFSVPQGATSASSIQLTTENADIPNFSLLGLIQGRDSSSSDISPGNYNYGYFGETNPTPAGSTPQDVGNSYSTVTTLDRTSESSVWNIDLGSNALTLQWINSDSSRPTTNLFIQSTALYFGGDQSAFASRYPSPVTPIALTFVPI